MITKLLTIAEREQIVIEYTNFLNPVKGLYWKEVNMPPIIGLDKALLDDTPRHCCVLAEELGHHFTTVGDQLPKQYYCFKDCINIDRAEYKAIRWAAMHLIPFEHLLRSFRAGIYEKWDLAEYFMVTEEMICFRLKLPDVKNMRLITTNAALIR